MAKYEFCVNQILHKKKIKKSSKATKMYNILGTEI